jgi:hypothetical protein
LAGETIAGHRQFPFVIFVWRYVLTASSFRSIEIFGASILNTSGGVVLFKNE